MASTRAGRKGRLEHLIRWEPEFRSEFVIDMQFDGSRRGRRELDLSRSLGSERVMHGI
jgi:hypothetical protein